MSTDTKLTRVALYCRVSSDEQAEHGVSLDDQRERLEAWAKARDYKIARTYIEEGEFGWNDDRPQLRNLLLDARAGRFTLLAVTKIDRFFRNERLLKNYIYELENLNVNFVSLSEGVDTREAGTGKLVLTLFGQFAEMEHDRISERVTDFRRHLANKGQWSSGRPPFGYRFNKEKKQLEICDLEAEGIRFIFAQYTQPEAIGIIRLAELLNKSKYMPPRMFRDNPKNRCWTQTNIRHVLTHPAYKGGPNEKWKFNTPAIISPEIWQQTKNRLANNQHFKPSKNNPALFRGKLRCDICGRGLSLGYNHSSTLVYECPGRHKATHMDGSARCTLPRLDVTTTDKKVMRKIDSIISDPGRLSKHIKRTIDALEFTKNQVFNELKPLEMEVAVIKEDMAIVNARLEKRQIDIASYKERIDKLELKLADVERRIKESDPLRLYVANAKQEEENRWREATISSYRKIYSLLLDGKSPFKWLTDEELEQQGPLEIHGLLADVYKAPFKLKPISGISKSAQPATIAPLGTVLSNELRNFKATMVGIVKSDGSIEIQGNILSRDLNISPAYMSARSRQSR
jgi:site-specific DNA recombinase